MHAAHNPVDFNDFTVGVVTSSRRLDNEHARFSIKGAKGRVPLDVCKRVDSGQTRYAGLGELVEGMGYIGSSDPTEDEMALVSR